MSTPNWDILHLRFASAVRDGVPNAQTDGDELTVQDRDAYLIYAYTKYVRLIAMYNEDALDELLPELFKTAIIVSTGNPSSAPLPDDFGYIVDLESTNANGVIVSFPKAKNWLNIKYSDTQQNVPSASNIFAKQIGNIIQFLPVDYSGTFELSYLVFQQNLIENGSEDILLRADHWDTIVSFAQASYYKDKQEFEIGKSIEQDAVNNSAFTLKVNP